MTVEHAFNYINDSDSQWPVNMMAIAQTVASWSKMPTGRGHGCVIALDERYIVATGYNGLPRGSVLSACPCEDMDKEWCAANCTAIHAEVNALASLARFGGPLDGRRAVAYCTKQPCDRCFGSLVNAGVAGIVWRQPNYDVKYKRAWEIHGLGVWVTWP